MAPGDSSITVLPRCGGCGPGGKYLWCIRTGGSRLCVRLGAVHSRAMTRDFVKAIESLAAERRAVADKEEQLLALLGRVLAGFGYRLVRGTRAVRVAARRLARSAGGAFVCPRCSRRFAQAMHLGRHLAASHGAKRETPGRDTAHRLRAKAVRRRAGGSRGTGRAPSPRRAASRRPEANQPADQSQARSAGNNTAKSQDRSSQERESARPSSPSIGTKQGRTRRPRSRRGTRARRRSARSKRK